MNDTLLQSMKRATGHGSVHDAPQLAAGFTDVFESYLVPSGELTLHAVIGGQGAPLLLLCGWPQNWFAWRHLMLPLSQSFTVIAVDPRGVGLSDIPHAGYDSKTLAKDMFGLMDTLGYERFAMVGHDVGMWTGFAMAHDQPGRIARIALGEALIPGISASPPLLPDERRFSDLFWHFNFNRAREINERLVEGRESLYFDYQFMTKAHAPDAIPAYARDFYIEPLKRDPNALRASFEYYRAIDASIPQNRARAQTGKLTLPVLAFAGAMASGGSVAAELNSVASDVQSIILADSGHYPAEETPAALLAAIQTFLAPYGQAQAGKN